MIDRDAGAAPGTVVTDLTDFDSVAATIRPGAFDAVVHLAGMPGRSKAEGHVVFRNNMLCSHSVLTAARKAAVPKIVFASSETILGLPFRDSPAELPITESSPTTFHVDHDYGTVKHLEDQIAQQMARDDPHLSISAMMLTTIVLPETYSEFGAFEDQPGERGYNLWSYTDVRDAAQGVILAAEYTDPGYERFILAADDTVMTTSTARLVSEHHPDSALTEELEEHGSLFSNQKARTMLGYAPRYTWRDA